MYHEEEKAQVRRRQTDTAIQLARASRWEEAVAVNRSILKLFPNDADSYNRLGKALLELNRLVDAKKAYKKALDLDATNQIAKKNLQRLTALAKKGVAQTKTATVDPSLFIEEMGKSAVTMVQRTEAEALTRLHAGDRVELRSQDGTLSVETLEGELVGVIEPKLTLRLIKLMDSGNKYAAAVTSLGEAGCQIIIKETYQDPSQAGRPSFPTAIPTEGTRPYIKGSILHYGTQAEEEEPADQAFDEDEIEGNGQHGDGDSWANETVLQEGHIRLNDAAAAEEAAEEEMEE